MSGSKPYYDHDPIWAQRESQGNPIWGSYSHIVYSQVLKWIADLQLNHASLLDVGCGAGAFGKRVEEIGLGYTGVDASVTAISLGRSHFPDLGLEVVDFALPLTTAWQARVFPLVTCINALHCLVGNEERTLFLRNLRQVCATGGHLILTTMIGPVPREHQDKRSPRAYSSGQTVCDELQNAGWNIITTQIEEPRRVHLAGNLVVICQRIDF